MGCTGSKHAPSQEPSTLLGRRQSYGSKPKDECIEAPFDINENEEVADLATRCFREPRIGALGARPGVLTEKTEWSETSSGFLSEAQAFQACCSGRRRLVLKGPLKDGHPGVRGARGRHYSAVRATQPGGIRIEDLMLGVKLACLAYTDDQRGTLEHLGGTRKAIETLAGGPERARRPLTEILQGLGYVVDRIFSHTAMLGSVRTVDTHGFIAHNDQDIVISYRGTTGIVEWLTDLVASPIPFQPHLGSEKHMTSCLPGRHPQAQAHQGFYDAFLASVCDINQKLMPQLRDLSRPKRLMIVGHSIGGAIAMGALGYLLQTYDFASSPHRILFVSTGQPRFGDEVFATTLDKQLASLKRTGKCCAVRLVNDCDAVPTVPQKSHGGYRHAAKLCLLTSEGDLLIGPEIEERDMGSLAENVDEHRTDHYLNLLANVTA